MVSLSPPIFFPLLFRRVFSIDTLHFFLWRAERFYCIACKLLLKEAITSFDFSILLFLHQILFLCKKLRYPFVQFEESQMREPFLKCGRMIYFSRGGLSPTQIVQEMLFKDILFFHGSHFIQSEFEFAFHFLETIICLLLFNWVNYFIDLKNPK